MLVAVSSTLACKVNNVIKYWHQNIWCRVLSIIVQGLYDRGVLCIASMKVVASEAP